MSRENVELVRSIYERGGLDSDSTAPFGLNAERLDEAIEFVNPPDAIDPGTRRGHAGLAAAWQSNQNSFEGWSYELRDVFDGGNCVVAAVASRAVGRQSGVEVAQEEVHTWTFRDGKLVRWEWGRDLAQALEAVGLRE